MKLGIDFGNSMIEIAARGDDGAIKCCNIPSAIDIKSGDNTIAISESVAVIECNGETVILGQGDPLVSIDKTRRRYLEHQILYSVYAALGSGAHVVELATGLPIALYKQKKDEFAERLSNIKKISGKVNGENVAVNIQSVKVCSEGHASLKALTDKVTHVTPTLVVDIGYGTTDAILFRWNEAAKKFVVEKYETFECALYDIYKMLREQLLKKGGDYSPEEIDKRLNSPYTIFRTANGDPINLAENLDLAAPVYDRLIRELENTFGFLYKFDLLFTGGGSSVFLKGIEKTNPLPNVIKLTKEEMYFSNAIGYVKSLK